MIRDFVDGDVNEFRISRGGRSELPYYAERDKFLACEAISRLLAPPWINRSGVCLASLNRASGGVRCSPERSAGGSSETGGKGIVRLGHAVHHMPRDALASGASCKLPGGREHASASPSGAIPQRSLAFGPSASLPEALKKRTASPMSGSIDETPGRQDSPR